MLPWATVQSRWALFRSIRCSSPAPASRCPWRGPEYSQTNPRVHRRDPGAGPSIRSRSSCSATVTWQWRSCGRWIDMRRAQRVSPFCHKWVQQSCLRRLLLLLLLPLLVVTVADVVVVVLTFQMLRSNHVIVTVIVTQVYYWCWGEDDSNPAQQLRRMT